MRVRSLGWEDPLEEDMQPTPAFLPGESLGQKHLVGYSPQGLKLSNMTEATEHAHKEVLLFYVALIFFFKFGLVTYLRNENGMSIVHGRCAYLGFIQHNRISQPREWASNLVLQSMNRKSTLVFFNNLLWTSEDDWRRGKCVSRL